MTPAGAPVLAAGMPALAPTAIGNASAPTASGGSTAPLKGAVQAAFGQPNPAYDELWGALRAAPQFDRLFGATAKGLTPAELKLLAVQTLLPLERGKVLADPAGAAAKRAGILNGYRDLADAKGLPWRASAAALAARGEDAWEAARREVADPRVVVPDYYIRGGGPGTIHSLEHGNTCWEAAFDVASGGVELVYAHHFPKLHPSQCFGALYGALHSEALAALRGAPVRRAVDLGCSSGTSTFALSRALHAAGHAGARVTGVDLSTHMLAVARHRLGAGDMRGAALARTDFAHADCCRLDVAGVDGGSCDVVVLAAVTHEMPRHVSELAVKEVARALRPGGVLAYFDLNPVQILRDNPMSNLVNRIAMANEPYLHEFLGLDIFATFRAAGLEVVKVRSSNEEIWPDVNECSVRLIIVRKPAAARM